MIKTNFKKHRKTQRSKLHAISKEFAHKVKDNPGVEGIVAKPDGTYLNLIVLLEPNIARDLQNEVFDAYGEIFDAYDGEVTFDFSSITCFSPDTVDEIAYDDPDNIIYRKGK